METIKRRKSASIKVGNVLIGAEAPIVIQSMTNTKTSDLEATLEQIADLHKAGCELIRVALPDEKAAAALESIVLRSPVPVIADIHFDLRLAYMALENGAAKIRINPGNIGGSDKLLELAGRAEQYAVPLRIGVNAGSLERRLLNKHGGATAEALVESALGYLKPLEKAGYHNFIVSLKASDVYTTISAYRLFSEKTEYPYPVHLGVTGAGTLEAGSIKGAIGIGTLLAEGIGDTLRVSLTADPIDEIRVARQILQALGLRRFTPELISCPTCGRCEINLVALAEKVEKILLGYPLPITVAVMGCAVNGPGEAREADLGLSAGKKQGILFRHGKVIKTIDLDRLLETFKEELDYHATNPGGGLKGV